MTQKEIEQHLELPGYMDTLISRILSRTENILRDMILFAEHLERKHNKGFVVYWCKAGHPRFEVCNVHEYYDQPEKDYNGLIQWHTNLAWKYVTE